MDDLAHERVLRAGRRQRGRDGVRIERVQSGTTVQKYSGDFKPGGPCAQARPHRRNDRHVYRGKHCRAPYAIADPTGRALRDAGVERVGLLGTRYTMEQTFYTGRLREQYLLDTLVPDEAGRDDVHRIIYDELCHGIVREESRATYQRMIDDLAARGAQAVIPGCTEITLLIKPEEASLPVFDTTSLHAQAAVEWAAHD
ncbi:aspartate/glutamate racemase family protein [Trinickia terrae]|uniref:aspartate/glutamate racemase family protein n=1 Tax=Trinickia terrae TaxID=2571161 RepID=UPI001F102F85|nr:amino acid racemase [Trinickia terrae]